MGTRLLRSLSASYSVRSSLAVLCSTIGIFAVVFASWIFFFPLRTSLFLFFLSSLVYFWPSLCYAYFFFRVCFRSTRRVRACDDGIWGCIYLFIDFTRGTRFFVPLFPRRPICVSIIITGKECFALAYFLHCLAIHVVSPCARERVCEQPSVLLSLAKRHYGSRGSCRYVSRGHVMCVV